MASLPPPGGLTCLIKSNLRPSKSVSKLPLASAANAEIKKDLPAWDSPKKPVVIGRSDTAPRRFAVLRKRRNSKMSPSASLFKRATFGRT